MDRSSDRDLTRSATASSSAGSAVIRPVESIQDMQACERLQKLAWDFDSDLDVVPLTQLVAARTAGGVILGAFSDAGEMLGFCYSFLGREPDGTLIHHSHMTAVEPGRQSAGIGARLKWAQREACLRAGIDHMVWTYDPLESLNAYFNFSKLGVVSDTYWENLYGETGSKLHRGTPTDRLKVDWYLASARVLDRERGGRSRLVADLDGLCRQLPVALQAAAAGHGPGEPRLDLEAPRLLCEIPASIQQVKQADAPAALAWRMATRTVFRHYLDLGWMVRECVRLADPDPHTFYLLERGASRPLED